MEESLTPDIQSPMVTFIADAMLGRLARWLRFMGFDTLYYPGINDSKLIRIAREQSRIILTRDTRLIKIKGLMNYLLISSEDPFQQLIEVLGAFKLHRFHLLSRCVKCNGPLSEIQDKEAIRDSVPEYVFLNYSSFLKCNDCGRIYWEGTHPRKFKEQISEIIG